MKSMQSIVLKHGLIAGGILIVAFAATLPFGIHSEVVGYTSMVLAFLLVFFGIRAYREEIGGAIGFGKAFQVGILITLVTCAVYVVAWEIVYWGFIPDFAETYSRNVLDKLRDSGATAEAVETDARPVDPRRRRIAADTSVMIRPTGKISMNVIATLNSGFL